MSALLAFDSVSKSYGSLRVTEDLSFTLAAGEALGVIGPNGAGKTTMFNLITGSVHPDTGRVVFQGRDITRLSPSARCHAGIGRSYQIPHPFGGMTVFENVLVGAAFGAQRSEQDSIDVAIDGLERAKLMPKANRLAGSLTLLERKRLELARALATQPRLLLIDEIAGGLTEREVDELIESIQSVRSEGISIIWIEHIVHALMAVVDRLLVMNFGRLLTMGRPAEVMDNPEVREVFMGIEVA